MFCLEDKLRPPANANPLGRDVFCILLLAGLAVSMLAGRGRDETLWASLVDQSTSVYLLPALGFLLALRCGAIDLSVWVCAGLAGVVAASLINSGLGAGLAFGAGIAVGFALGAVNAVFVAALRLPSVAVTLATAWLLMWGVQSAAGARGITVPFDVFSRWADALDLPQSQVRRLTVGTVYVAVLSALLCSGRLGRRLGSSSRLLTGIALCASGVLAAAGGLCWLLDHARAPVPTRLVDDLRIPVAAALAGGAFLSGTGRTVLAAVYLPVALVLATLWRQEVWQFEASGYWLQLLLLVGMVIVSQMAAGEAMAARRPGRGMAIAAAALTAVGIVTLGGSSGIDSRFALTVFRLAGMAAWLAGAVLLVIARARAGPGPPGRARA